MDNPVSIFLTGMAGGGLGAGLLLALLRAFTDFRLESAKAKYVKELEELKARYARELERTRASFDRSVFVTRAQFETEFAALKDVYRGLAEVRLQLNGVRPSMAVEPQEEPFEQRHARFIKRVQSLVTAYDGSLALIENTRAFYPDSVHAQALECLKAAQAEIVDCQTIGKEAFSIESYQSGNANRHSFMEAYSRITDLIRERISQLSVMPEN
jgi:hypothetical protein